VNPLLESFVFGVTVALAVGPIALLIMAVSATSGLGAGLRSAAGAATADLGYAAVAFGAGYRLAPLLEERRSALEIIASLVLIGFGLWMLVSALRTTRGAFAAAPTAPLLSRPFVQTLALTAINPLTLLLFAGFGARLPALDSPATAVACALLLALGSLLIQAVLALGGAGLRRLLSTGRRLALVNALSGAGIAAFGAVGLLRMAGR
jgi:threonine/homoserine/homoserine lactone efflux protein